MSAAADPSIALDADIRAFEARQTELEQAHRGKYVVFFGSQLVGTWDTFDAAAADAVKRFGRGPYLIRLVGGPPATLPASVLYRPSTAT
jgi:hypothetical protein